MHADTRPARASDVEALVALENSLFSTDRISVHSFRRLIRSVSAAVMVRTSGDRLAGYAVVLFRKGSSSARLYSIAVDPGFAGVGYGLLLAAEAEARRRDAGEMRLEVREDNSRAIALYERSGYTVRDRVANYYADGAPALRFRKTLANAGAAAA